MLGHTMKNKEQDVYTKPLPIDTINKFWGVDSRLLKQDDTVQKQSFDQSYKNFWSFVDFNSNIDNMSTFVNLQTQNGSTTNNFSTNKGVTNSSNMSNSIHNNNQRVSYSEARRRADELIRTGGK